MIDSSEFDSKTYSNIINLKIRNEEIKEFIQIKLYEWKKFSYIKNIKILLIYL